MARQNRTRYTVLGTLTHGPKSGYDIKKFIERSISNFWRESYGQIYPTLKQLAHEGLVTRKAATQPGKPARYIYSITKAGRRELRTWLEEPADPEVPRHEFLLKLFFGAQLTPDANLRHVERYRAEVEAALDMCQNIHDRLRQTKPDSPDLPFWLMGLRQGILVHEALQRWCDETRRTLNRMRSQ
jgi:DNA-binding PadR family transcriptional regulator